MLKDLNQIIEKVIDFCGERTDVLMIGGVALIVLIVLISVIRSIVKKDDDEDYDFDEKAYFDELLNEKKNRYAKEVSEEPETPEPVSQNCRQHVIFPEELLEELAKVPSNNLQEVEIKIQSAELKFKYSGAKSEDGQVREEVVVFEEKAVGDEAAEEICIEEQSADGTVKVEKEEQPELVKEELEELKVTPPVKFGAGNYNISKSGKIFTEEELEKQIRD